MTSREASGSARPTEAIERDILWAPVDVPGIEHLRLTGGSAGWLADGLILRLLDGVPFRLSYRIEIGPDWHTRRLLADAELPASVSLRIESDGEGHWRREDGEPLPELDGCLDVDIAATPFTNTLPVRRLGLGPGESAEIAVVYTSVPDLSVTLQPQRYTCLSFTPSGGIYRYEGLSTGFRRDLAVDADGLVLDYPGIWRRAWPQLNNVASNSSD